MKAKAKFDPKIIQQFFIDHTEKIVAGLVAVLFVYFAYQSFMLKGYEEKPEKLQSLTTTAEKTIADGPKTENKKPEIEFPITDFQQEINESRQPLDPGGYAWSNWPSATQVPPLRLREMPQAFPVEQLRAIPGRGAIAGKEGVTGMHWVAVTGLVPIRKQLSEYKSVFAGANYVDAAKDIPDYHGFFVQRAEVLPGATGEPAWEKAGGMEKLYFVFGRKAVVKLVDNWARTDAEIVSPKFVFPTLCSPLPPWEDGVWGKEVAYLPEIPVASPDEMGPANPTPGQGPGLGRMEGQFPRNQGLAHPKGGNFAGPIGPGASLGPAGVEDDVLGGGVKPKTDGSATKIDDDAAQAPEYALLRYFDFDVKPTKQYRYRVFLVLANPNRGANAESLDDAELAKFAYVGQGKEQLEGTLQTAVAINTNYAHWSDASDCSRVASVFSTRAMLTVAPA